MVYNKSLFTDGYDLNGLNGPAITGLNITPNTIKLGIDNKIYALNSSNNAISVIDRSTYSISRTILTKFGPSDFAVDDINEKLYIANTTTDVIQIVDLNTFTEQLVSHTNPYSIAINPNLNRLYIADRQNTIQVMDTNTRQIIRTITVGSHGSIFISNLLYDNNILYALHIPVSTDIPKLYFIEGLI